MRQVRVDTTRARWIQSRSLLLPLLCVAIGMVAMEFQIGQVFLKLWAVKYAMIYSPYGMRLLPQKTVEAGHHQRSGPGVGGSRR